MPKFNAGELVNTLQKVLDAAQQLAPIAQQIGGPVVANAATVVIATAAIAENAIERFKDGKLVASSRDQEAVKAILGELQTVNDKLAAAISAS